MQINDGAGDQDLFLNFLRRLSSRWEPKRSPAKFNQPLVVINAEFGNVYIQGSVTDPAGKELAPEAVARLIESYGHSAVNHLEGSFVIAVDDSRHGVWCATDHSATLPLYYKLTPDELTITTRAENLKISGPDEVDLAGIITSLNAGYPWGALTLLRDWKVLRPGQVLRIDKQNASDLAFYFDPETDEAVEGFKSTDDLVKEIDTCLLSIASRYKRILLPLSGGVDSRLIAVRCHKLDIPFEAITFVANVPDGDDYDIASRLVKVFNVKHHRWEWNPSPETCIDNFRELCIATGGLNDAFTSYPDGMKTFAKVASEFDCILRGDHVFGLGPYSDSAFNSATILGFNLYDNLNWALMPPSVDKVDLHAVFEQQEQVGVNVKGDAANNYKHKSYRMTRSPRFLLPIGQLQAQHTVVAYPFLTRNIVKKMSRTESTQRDNKLIAYQTLEACSPPGINRIPISQRPTWKNGEPLLNLPREVTDEMIRIVRTPTALSEIVNESVIAGGYEAFLSGKEHKIGKKGIVKNIKEIVKRVLPKSMVSAYQQGARRHHRVGPYMSFKRYFAMKVYVDKIL